MENERKRRSRRASGSSVLSRVTPQFHMTDSEKFFPPAEKEHTPKPYHKFTISYFSRNASCNYHGGLVVPGAVQVHIRIFNRFDMIQVVHLINKIGKSFFIQRFQHGTCCCIFMLSIF